MNRRALLRRVAGAGTAGVVGGCLGRGRAGRRSAGRTTTGDGEGDPPHADEFERVVDAVEAGADPTGERPVDDLLADRFGSGTLLYFPPGEYRLSDRVTAEGFWGAGIVGRDATVRPPAGYDGYLLDLGRPGRARHLLVEGLTFDFRAADTGARALHAHVDDGLRVNDLRVVGRQESDQTAVRVAVTAPDGTGAVRRLDLPDGGAAGTDATGCYVPPASVGDLSLLSCRVAGFPRNGLYASAAGGTVRVVGGRYADNGVANLRVGDGAVVRGATVRCDEATPGFDNMRGIRIDGGSGVRVEDATVVLRDVTGSDGGIVLSRATGSATVRDTRIRVDADDVAAVFAKPTSAATGGPLRCTGLTVSGDAAGGAAVVVREREDCRFEDVAVCATGADRDGFRFDGASGVLDGAAVSVPGRPLVTRDAAVETRSVDTGLSAGTCRSVGGLDCDLPDAVWPYAGTDCAVATPDLRRALGDWLEGTVDADTLHAVARAWIRTGDGDRRR